MPDTGHGKDKPVSDNIVSSPHCHQVAAPCPLCREGLNPELVAWLQQRAHAVANNSKAHPLTSSQARLHQ
jgi:hypothetical protein